MFQVLKGYGSLVNDEWINVYKHKRRSGDLKPLIKILYV